MDNWGTSHYGNPCRECGYDWTLSMANAVSLVSNLPDSYRELLNGRSGNEQNPGLSWSVAEYVTHVADNLRIWAERLMGVVGGAPHLVGSYDENVLARARNYREISIQAAMWSLTRSVEDWLRAIEASAASGEVLLHPVRGEMTLSDVVHANAHDAIHHQWDIVRTFLDLDS